MFRRKKDTEQKIVTQQEANELVSSGRGSIVQVQSKNQVVVQIEKEKPTMSNATPPTEVRVRNTIPVEITRLRNEEQDGKGSKRIVVLRKKVRKTALAFIVLWPVMPKTFSAGTRRPLMYYVNLQGLQKDGVLRYDIDSELPMDEQGNFIECPGLEQWLMDATLDQLAEAIQVLAASFVFQKRHYVILGLFGWMSFFFALLAIALIPGLYSNVDIHWLPTLPNGFRP